jgi:hypothetical protein
MKARSAPGMGEPRPRTGPAGDSRRSGRGQRGTHQSSRRRGRWARTGPDNGGRSGQGSFGFARRRGTSGSAAVGILGRENRAAQSPMEGSPSPLWELPRAPPGRVGGRSLPRRREISSRDWSPLGTSSLRAREGFPAGGKRGWAGSASARAREAREVAGAPLSPAKLPLAEASRWIPCRARILPTHESARTPPPGGRPPFLPPRRPPSDPTPAPMDPRSNLVHPAGNHQKNNEDTAPHHHSLPACLPPMRE